MLLFDLGSNAEIYLNPVIFHGGQRETGRNSEPAEGDMVTMSGVAVV